MSDLTLKFAMDVEATDTERRTITGRIVPYGVPGNTSIGPVTFTAGALDYDVDDVKLLLEHDHRRPIGKAVQFAHGEDGIVGTFRISATTAGADALIEAADGLRDGLSVGVRVTAHDDGPDGSLLVTAGELEEVSLVVRPAFTDARVTEVAASEPDPDPDPEEAMTEHTEDVTPVTAADTTEEPDVQAAEPPTTRLQVRDRAIKPLTAGEQLQHTIRAAQGIQESLDIVRVLAADAPTNTTGVGGIVPTPQMNEIIGIIDSRRPFVDRIERRPLPGSGMSFKVPVRGTKVGDFVQIEEETEVEADEMTFTDVEVDVVAFKKRTILSFEAVDRTDPSVLQDQLVQFAEAWAQTVDKWAITKALADAGTSDATTLRGAVIKGITDSSNVVRQRPDRLLLANDKYEELLNVLDGADRPLYPSLSPQNASGTAQATSDVAIIEGLNAFVDYNAAAGTIAVFPSMAARLYESPGAPAQIRVAQLGAMQWEFGVYGYVAFLPKYATAVRNLTVTT